MRFFKSLKKKEKQKREREKKKGRERAEERDILRREASKVKKFFRSDFFNRRPAQSFRKQRFIPEGEITQACVRMKRGSEKRENKRKRKREGVGEHNERGLRERICSCGGFPGIERFFFPLLFLTISHNSFFSLLPPFPLLFGFAYSVSLSLFWG